VRYARALLPYFAAALVIATGSTALVFATIEGTDLAGGASSDSLRAAPELSTSARLAYWRQNPAGAFILWVANPDATAARPLLTLGPGASRPTGTRWTGDGRAVAFISDAGLSVIGLDGSRIEVALPLPMRTAGFRIIDQRWSPSGAHVAATLYRSTDGKSEVHLASLEARELVRAGDLGNAFAREWLSDDEVLVESDRGVLGALRRTGALRRLVAQSAASPVLDAGRVHYLAGPIGATGDPSGIFVSSPSVWSVRPDGTDAKQEARLEVGGDLRLDGRWPDGRYLLHVFRDRTQWLAGPRLASLTSSTLLQRVVVSDDRRFALGFGSSRIVRIDLTRGLTPVENAFVVLLDGVTSADVWMPRTPLL
jgi:hypothetical protein